MLRRIIDRVRRPSPLACAVALRRGLVAYAAALAPVGTEETVFRICEAIW
jgi:hypothetical protein